MPFARIDTGFHRHPKASAVGIPGRALYISGLCFCAEQLTDGRIPKGSVPIVAAEAGVKPSVADALVEVGLWHDRGDHYYVNLGDDLRPLASLEYDRDRTPEWLRQQVIQRDGLICSLCSRDVERDDVHIDHVRPVARGGRTEPRNLQVAHSTCNIRKGASWLEDA